MTARLLGLGLLLLLAGCGSMSTPAGVPQAANVSPTRQPSATLVPVQIKVYVTGAVARPGVYALGPDSRVEDAVTAAGGFVAGADMPRVNLAARLKDEDEIFVPTVGQTSPDVSVKSVNVNTASAAKLRDGLGIPAALASRIVAYRRQHGPFRTLDDLRLVPVPDAQLSRIRAQASTG